jgi:MbtH protein
MNEEEDNNKYKVLVNHEEQYSLWLDYNPIPKGWREVKCGTKQECLAYVKEVWTDMRPLSLRKKMEATAAANAPQTAGAS